ALCFMTFTMGKDLGLVMAKGVVLGVIGCVTVLPSMILILDKPLQKLMHRSLIPNMEKLSGLITKRFPIFLVLFVAITIPAFIGYQKTNNEVYYDMADSLPQDLDYAIANAKLKNDFDVAATHMVLASADLSAKDTRAMIKEMEKVDGIKFALGLDSLIGAGVPEDILPDSLRSVLKSDKWRLILVNSEYRVASDAVNEQLNKLNTILKKYDPKGMLIGEAPCMKDMIETTDRDFRVVNIISIAAIFIIIALVEQSLTLPFILIAVIEAAIFINLGLPHYLGDSLPFIAPICISTIQLGATVDYAILMTTRYKKERIEGNDKVQAIKIALTTSIPSIIVSGMGLFSATFGVAVYSDIDMISSMCILLARGAIISVVMVVLTLPAMLMLFDKIIIKTTAGMKTCEKSA
nr:MMPL family transporter [Lachnospiraceae bacterium]